MTMALLMTARSSEASAEGEIARGKGRHRPGGQRAFLVADVGGGCRRRGGVTASVKERDDVRATKRSCAVSRLR